MVWGWFLIIVLVVGYLLIVLAMILLASYQYQSPTISSIKQSRDYYLVPPHWSKYPLWSSYGNIKPTFVDRTGRFDLVVQKDQDIYYLAYSTQHDSLVLTLKAPMEQLLGSLEWYMEATDKTIVGQLYYYPITGENKRIVVCSGGRLSLRNSDITADPVYLIKFGNYVYLVDSNFIPLSLLQFPLINSNKRVVNWPQVWNPLLYPAQYGAAVGLTIVIKNTDQSVSLYDPKLGRLDPISHRVSIPWFYNYNSWKLTPASVPDGTYFFVSEQRDTLILTQRPSLTDQLVLDATALIDVNTCLTNSETISDWLNSALVIVNNRVFIGSYNGSSLQPRPLGTSQEGIISIVSLNAVNNGKAVQFQLFEDQHGYIVLADSQRNPMLLSPNTTFDQIDRTIPTTIPVGWYNPETGQPIRGHLYRLIRGTDRLLNQSMENVMSQI